MQRAMWVFWPSFIVAVMAETLFFAAFDPADVSLLWEVLGPSGLAAYSQIFFLFWVLAAASSGLTLFLQRTSDEVNRLCPLEPPDRPPGCPKRELPESQ